MYSDSEAYNVKDRNAKTEAAMCVTSMLLDFPSGRGEDGLTATQYANTLAKNYKHRISDENLPGFVDGLVILFKRFDKDRAAIMNHSHKIFQSSKPDDTTSTHSTLTARY